MKLSVSLPDDDVAFLDDYAGEHGFTSRSAALHKAVRLLRAAQLGVAYEDAFEEWHRYPDAREWEATAADGLGA
jgi:Arc/MetJ-type ribon-helix-helix transcriptional regulator